MQENPVFTTNTTDLQNLPYWVLLRTSGEVLPKLVFVGFHTASSLLVWYNDASVSAGEEGRYFSRLILATSQPWEELQLLADSEAEELARNDGSAKSMTTKKTGWFESIVGGCEIELENGMLLWLTAEQMEYIGVKAGLVKRSRSVAQ